MLRLNKKGFLLVDSIICVLIVTLIAELCFSTYKTIINDENTFDNYVHKQNNYYEYIFDNLDECEACHINEPD